jgi:chemotaxis protein CheD
MSTGSSEEVVMVRIGEMKVGRPPSKLTAVGLGSCVAIFIRDTGTGIGGMAHAMLPWLPKEPRSGANLMKYADFAIEKMVGEILDAGGGVGGLEAKIAGGAHMFEGSQGEFPIDVGERNLEAARKKLIQMEIPLISEDAGGRYGRSVVAHLEDGRVRVRSLKKGSHYI